MNGEYKQTQDIGRRDTLKTISDTDRRIADIYRRAADALAADAMRAGHNTLTERWALDYRVSLNQRIRELNRDLTETVVDASRQGAANATNATTSWLDHVLANTGSQIGGASFSSVLSRTPDEALHAVISGQAYLDGRNLSSRIWSATARTEQGINAVIEQGIAQHRSAVQIARDLEQFVNPDARREIDLTDIYPDIPEWLLPQKIDYNAQRLARTSINHAYHIAMKEAATKNPFATAIHWALSPQHAGADICDEYARNNEGLGMGNFPIEAVPLPHAQCLCHQYAVVEKNIGECAKELADWLNGASNEALDAAFGEWKQSLPQNGIGGTMESDSVQDAPDPRTRLLHDIAGQNWAGQLGDADREAVFDVLNKATDTELKFWARHGEKIQGEFDYKKGGAHYSPRDRGVHLNMGAQTGEMQRIGATSNTPTFFHEVGHLFDYQAYEGKRLASEMPDLDAKLKADYLRHANQVLEGVGAKPLKNLSRFSLEQKHALIADLQDDPDIKSSVSDLAGGMTGNRVVGRWGHSAEYWQYHSPSTEAIAEMFEAMMIKDERLATMQQYFPDSYQYFVDTLTRLEGGK